MSDMEELINSLMELPRAIVERLEKQSALLGAVVKLQMDMLALICELHGIDALDDEIAAIQELIRR